MTGLWHCFLADFRARRRQGNFGVTLLFMALLTMIFFPALDASYQTLVINGYRGIYNSAWMGAALAILSVLFLPVICFYLIKNAIGADGVCGVSCLIVATPVQKYQYVIGKWLSNFCLLILMILTMSLVSIPVQLFYGESYLIDPVALLLPQLVFVIPVLAILASLALLFEAIPLLRGSLGNIAAFFLWVAAIVGTVGDASGVNEILVQMTHTVQQFAPGDDLNIGVLSRDVTLEGKLGTFVWLGLDYNYGVVQAVAKMYLLALALLGAAIFFFDRFGKPAHPQSRQSGAVKLPAFLTLALSYMAGLCDRLCEPWAFSRLLHQEFRLLFRGRKRLWYLLFGVGILAQLLVPDEMLLAVIVPVSLLLCILVLSPLGHREHRNRTSAFIFTSPLPLGKQFVAMVSAGLLLLILCVSGALFRLLLTGQLAAVLVLLIGLLFMVCMALCCGVLTGSGRMFEALFLAIWYIGPLNSMPYLDFIGVDLQASLAVYVPWVFLGTALCLLLVALWGRRRRLI
jgi:hypothetical protein